MISSTKNVIDQAPLVLLMGIGGTLLLLSMYSLAAASVVEHLKDKVSQQARKFFKKDKQRGV